MEIELSPELQAKLDRIASRQERDSKSLVHGAIERLVGYNEWFICQVETGLPQVDRGEGLGHEHVVACMESLITQKQRRTRCVFAGLRRPQMTCRVSRIISLRKLQPTPRD